MRLAPAHGAKASGLPPFELGGQVGATPSVSSPLVRGKNSKDTVRRKRWQHGRAARKCGILAVSEGETAGGCDKLSRRCDYYFLESLSTYHGDGSVLWEDFKSRTRVGCDWQPASALEDTMEFQSTHLRGVRRGDGDNRA